MSHNFQKTQIPRIVSKTPKGAEARRTPRRVFLRAIGLLRHGEYILVQALQLSEGGMLFQSPVQFAVGDAIVLSLIIPGGSSIVVRGEVIYSKPGQGPIEPQYGVKFAPLALQPRRLIRIYVTAKTQAEAEAEHFDS